MRSLLYTIILSIACYSTAVNANDCSHESVFLRSSGDNLHLTAEQREQVYKILTSGDQRQGCRELLMRNDLLDKIRAVLNEEQNQLLTDWIEASAVLRHTSGFADPVWFIGIGLTSDQWEKINHLMEQVSKKWEKLQGRLAQSGDIDNYHDQVHNLKVQTQVKLQLLLTDKQLELLTHRKHPYVKGMAHK